MGSPSTSDHPGFMLSSLHWTCSIAHRDRVGQRIVGGSLLAWQSWAEEWPMSDECCRSASTARSQPDWWHGRSWSDHGVCRNRRPSIGCGESDSMKKTRPSASTHLPYAHRRRDVASLVMIAGVIAPSRAALVISLKAKAAARPMSNRPNRMISRQGRPGRTRSGCPRGSFAQAQPASWTYSDGRGGCRGGSLVFFRRVIASRWCSADRRPRDDDVTVWKPGVPT